MIFHLITYVFLYLFWFEITMGKEIRRIYKYDQQKWPCTSPKTNFVIPPHFDTYIQNQQNSSSDSSVGENDVSSTELYQSTNHNGNTDETKMINSHLRQLRKVIAVIPLLVIK